MATKRQRGSSWEFVVRRKGLLDKPLSLTFDTEAEGDAYCAKLEALLDRGIVPDEIRTRTDSINTISEAIHAYLNACAVKENDQFLLGVIRSRIGQDRLLGLDFNWAEAWVRKMKHSLHLSPSTIRHHVGALARCLDWVLRKHPLLLPVNPLRMLPKGYATYNEVDRSRVEVEGGAAPEDEDRDRRLDPEEEQRIRKILAGEKPEGRQRAFELKHREALVVFFDLALETAMRMSELYTLDWSQVDLAKRTIYLNKTKNGSKRQVPLSSVALRILQEFHALSGHGQLFPWWDGEQTTRSRQRTTSLLSRQFGRIFDAAQCGDLRFHDLRHEAISRLYERTTLDTTVIRKIVGHFSAKAHDRYVNLRASNFAEKLW